MKKLFSDKNICINRMIESKCCVNGRNMHIVPASELWSIPVRNLIPHSPLKLDC